MDPGHVADSGIRPGRQRRSGLHNQTDRKNAEDGKATVFGNFPIFLDPVYFVKKYRLKYFLLT